MLTGQGGNGRQAVIQDAKPTSSKVKTSQVLKGRQMSEISPRSGLWNLEITNHPGAPLNFILIKIIPV